MKASSRELAFDRCGVRLVIVDAAGAGIEARLAGAEPPWAPAGDARSADLRYVIEPWRPAWGASGTGFRVSRDGAVRYLGTCHERLAKWLRADVDEQAPRRSGNAVAVRGAAVIWRERSILIPARRAGETVGLVSELARCGAAHCANDIVLLDDDGRVHAHGEVREESAAPLALIVEMTYAPGLSWRPSVRRGARALLPIIAGAFAEGTPPQRALRLAARLAPRVATLQGPRGEVAGAAPQVLAALDELLDGGAAKPMASRNRRLVALARQALEARGWHASEPQGDVQ